jgi:tetratricopeptide (TPR) repeat protein
VAAAAARQVLQREAVRRQLKITERQLQSWERHGLIAKAEIYGFHDLLALRAISKLSKSRVRLDRIKLAVNALRERMGHTGNPLTELRIFADGRRIHVEIDGRAMEPVSGQLLLDFDAAELRRLVKFPETNKRNEEVLKKQSAEKWFERGLELEQSGAPLEDVVNAYEVAVALDPNSAGALVNLGTVYFNKRDWSRAEKYYLKALEVDPGYALAHFDLGNLFDETNQRSKALFHYQAALRLNPQYADAHYNLALLYQTANDSLRAVKHWKAYLKLDPQSKWASIARRELARLRESTILTGRRRDRESGA